MAILTSLMATLHHLCAFTLSAGLIFEFVAFRPGLGVEEARRIQRVDVWYGVSAALLEVVGLLRVFFFEKGASFYVANLMFWIRWLCSWWLGCSPFTQPFAISNGIQFSQKINHQRFLMWNIKIFVYCFYWK